MVKINQLKQQTLKLLYVFVIGLINSYASQLRLGDGEQTIPAAASELNYVSASIDEIKSDVIRALEAERTMKISLFFSKRSNSFMIVEKFKKLAKAGLAGKVVLILHDVRILRRSGQIFRWLNHDDTDSTIGRRLWERMIAIDKRQGIQKDSVAFFRQQIKSGKKIEWKFATINHMLLAMVGAGLTRIHLRGITQAMVMPSIIKQITSVQELFITHCNIPRIYDQGFLYLQRLRVLNLSHNKIVTIDEMAFKRLDQLEILDLSYNKLISLPSSLLILPNIKIIYMEGGFDCDTAQLVVNLHKRLYMLLATPYGQLRTGLKQEYIIANKMLIMTCLKAARQMHAIAEILILSCAKYFGPMSESTKIKVRQIIESRPVIVRSKIEPRALVSRGETRGHWDIIGVPDRCSVTGSRPQLQLQPPSSPRTCSIITDTHPWDFCTPRKATEAQQRFHIRGQFKFLLIAESDAIFKD